jgi:hypothetical protein
MILDERIEHHRRMEYVDALRRCLEKAGVSE